MPTLRRLIAASTPHVSMKLAWRGFVQALRAYGRETGEKGEHRDRRRLERTLDRELEPTEAQLVEIKSALHRLVYAELDATTQAHLAHDIDLALLALVPRTADGPVQLRVHGWPDGLDLAQQSLLLGLPAPGVDDPPLELSAEAAAALVDALDGIDLGGSQLRVEVELPEGVVLPAVPRDLRDRSPRSGSRAWLTHLDDEGHRCLTPKALANAQAAMLDAELPPGAVVVDAFCGCGGNALALAALGRTVIAIELDPARADLARLNAEEHDLALDLRVGDAALLLADIAVQQPGAGLLLDPPWGGPGHSDIAVGWSALLPLPDDALTGFGPVLLKAPRAFDPATLPASRRWSWRFELGPAGADGRATVLALSCLGLLPDRP